MADKPKAIAVALLSGGLDSTLAAKVILEQSIKVIGVNFAGAYCPRPRVGRSNAEKAAEQLGIGLVTLPIDADFIAMVKRPKHSLPSGARLAVGRDEVENDELLRRKPAGAAEIDAGDLPGPVGIVVKGSSDVALAARICARYSDKRREPAVKVKVAEAEITVQPAGEEETARLLIA